MATDRIEVRLDPEDRRMLAELAEEERSSMSEVVRRMIKSTYKANQEERRQEAARRLVALEIEDVPEPEELSRQLATKYDFERLP